MDVDGDRLRELRRQKVWTLRRLKAESGVAADTIYDLEHGLRQARQVTIHKLAEALGVEPKELLRSS